MAIKQISDLSIALKDELNEDCVFIIDKEDKSTRQISFGEIEKKIKTDILSSISITFDNIYPIGSIYITVSPNLPTIFTENGRQWSKIQAGRCLWSVGSGDKLNTLFSAGLPNITGTFQGPDVYKGSPSSDGAFTHEEYQAEIGGGGGGPHMKVTFDASRSNPIYGNSTTVQPPSIGVYMWKRIR